PPLSDLLKQTWRDGRYLTLLSPCASWSTPIPLLSAWNFKNPSAISALSIGSAHFLAARRTWFPCYDEIDADTHQGDRNEKEKILYRSEHCHLIRSVVGQKSIEHKQQDRAADHERTGFDS